MFRIAAAISLVFAAAGCAGEITGDRAESALEISTLDDTTIEGTFVYAGSVVEFRSHSSDQAFGTLTLVVNGSQFDVTADIPGMTFEQDGHDNSLYQEDRDALAALSDAISDEYPDLVENTLFVKLVAGHAGRLAEAPDGVSMAYRVVDVAQLQDKLVQRSRSCNDDGVKCMSGRNGEAYAYFDKAGGSCLARWRKYGDNAPYCAGRCGAGCKSWDHNYTQDCMDHDYCTIILGGSNYGDNPNCGDEFWHADDDYVVTYWPWYC